MRYPLSILLTPVFLLAALLLGLVVGLILSTSTITCPSFLEEERVIEGSITIAGLNDDDREWLEECFAQGREVEEE